MDADALFRAAVTVAVVYTAGMVTIIVYKMFKD